MKLLVLMRNLLHFLLDSKNRSARLFHCCFLVWPVWHSSDWWEKSDDALSVEKLQLFITDQYFVWVIVTMRCIDFVTRYKVKILKHMYLKKFQYLHYCNILSKFLKKCRNHDFSKVCNWKLGRRWCFDNLIIFHMSEFGF